MVTSHEEIKKHLLKLPFVQWDRYAEVDSIQAYYGWIDRDDQYKDFVALFFENCTVWYLSSSAKYTHQIGISLGMSDDSHADCKRIEHLFPDIKNVIKLKK